MLPSFLYFRRSVSTDSSDKNVIEIEVKLLVIMCFWIESEVYFSSFACDLMAKTPFGQEKAQAYMVKGYAWAWGNKFCPSNGTC